MVTSRWDDATRADFDVAADAAMTALRDHIAAVSASHSDADSGSLALTAERVEAALHRLSLAEEQFTGAAAFWVDVSSDIDAEDEVVGGEVVEGVDLESGAGSGSAGGESLEGATELFGPLSCLVELRLFLDLDAPAELLAHAQELSDDESVETIPDAIFAVAATHGWDAIMADQIEDVHLASAVAEVHLTEQDQDHEASE